MLLRPLRSRAGGAWPGSLVRVASTVADSAEDAAAKQQRLAYLRRWSQTGDPNTGGPTNGRSTGGPPRRTPTKPAAGEAAKTTVRLDTRPFAMPLLTLMSEDTPEALVERLPRSTQGQVPVVLDLSRVRGGVHQVLDDDSLCRIVDVLRQHGHHPAGIHMQGPERQKEYLTRTLGLPLLSPHKEAPLAPPPNAAEPASRAVESPPAPPPPPPQPKAPPSRSSDDGSVDVLLYEGSVRSGQQVFAKGRSLVVVGSVNPGAEVLADGSIFVWGALKGRALAGIAAATSQRDREPANSDAKIVAHKFDAELVAIGPEFATIDSPRDAATQWARSTVTTVSLRGGKLRIESE